MACFKKVGGLDIKELEIKIKKHISAFWKVHMVFLRSLDDSVWMSVEDGWTRPDINQRLNGIKLCLLIMLFSMVFLLKSFYGISIDEFLCYFKII